MDRRMEHDELTQLASRKTFLEEFTSLISAAQTNETPLSLSFLDLDHFLLINQKYGHYNGDLVLNAIAGILRQSVSPETIMARYGGDEFALLFPGFDREAAFLAVERIRAKVEEIEIISDRDVIISGLTITGGVASFPVDGRTQSELIRKADQALYKAKKDSRNKVRLAYDERMVAKTAHFTQTQLERLSKLAEERQAGEAELLREALDDLLTKYGLTDIER
jgi:diguanylate cyclase (GGDEF)-like protein